MTKRRSLYFTAFGLMTVSLALWASNRVNATQPQFEQINFGMVGVTAGQTLRLNAVNVPVPQRRLPPNPCVIMLSLVDDLGQVILETTKVLNPGQATTVDVTGDALVGRVGNRAQVRAVVRVLDDSPGNRLPPNPCIATLEIFDTSSGRTELLYEGTVAEQLSAAN